MNSRTSITAMLALTCALAAGAAAQVTTPPVIEARRAVDLAICLDTSGSMQGLIDSARQKLWEIVNDLALAKPMPELRVALLTFGNNGHVAENGWVRVDSGLTGDLDLIAQQLFALSTNGGTELVGRVLQSALQSLDWSKDPGALKLMIVAGNESAEQDTLVNFRDVCKAAISKGIMVNSIYCGPAADEIAPAWREVAVLADGHFTCIDHNEALVAIESPFDQALMELSSKINTTYIPVGSRGWEAAKNQAEQDTNAAKLNTNCAAGRAATKGSDLYVCSWDLVDASQAKDFKWESLKDEDLPEDLRKLSLEARKQRVVELRTKRGEMQKQIKDLNVKREEFVQQEREKQSNADPHSFDHAVRKAVRDQAQTKGFEFPRQEPKKDPEHKEGQ